MNTRTESVATLQSNASKHYQLRHENKRISAASGFDISKLQERNFVQLSNSLLDHVFSTSDLLISEKIYYLVNYFYSQLFDSWNRSSNINDQKEIEFSASKIASLLGSSKPTIFRLQKSLEKKGYLQIKRSLSNFGSNQVNVPIVTMPLEVFNNLIKNKQNKKKIIAGEGELDVEYIKDIDHRIKTLNSLKTYIPINVDLAKFIFFNQDLADYAKLLYLKLLASNHKQKLKNNYANYAGYFELANLRADCNISESTLHRCLKSLENNNLIKTSIIQVKRKKEQGNNNRFDKKLKYVELLLPEAFRKDITNTEKCENTVNSENSLNTVNNEDIEKKDRLSEMHPQPFRYGSPYILEKEIEKNNLKNRSKKSNFVNDDSGITDAEIKKENSNEKSFEKRQKRKEIKDFYPVNKQDCDLLRRKSGRNFIDLVINEITLDMSRKVSDRLFYSKKGFISYMSKALMFEKRSEMIVNNVNFKIKANMTSDEQNLHEVESYLTKLEYSLDTSPEMHLKKKLASVLAPCKAYNLLTSISNMEIKEDKYVFSVKNKITLNSQLTDLDKEIILNQVKAVYGSINIDKASGMVGFGLEKIEFIEDKIFGENNEIVSNEIASNQAGDKEKLPKNIWGKVREGLILYFNKDIDNNWFSASKLNALIDEDKKKLNLKAATLFIKDYININYIDKIIEIAENLGYKVESLE